jgi:hypothetical protein
VYNSDHEIVERYESDVASRGMQFEAWELERLVAGGEVGNLPPAETVAIMGTLDEIRSQIGLTYPGGK